MYNWYNFRGCNLPKSKGIISEGVISEGITSLSHSKTTYKKVLIGK